MFIIDFLGKIEPHIQKGWTGKFFIRDGWLYVFWRGGYIRVKTENERIVDTQTAKRIIRGVERRKNET